MAKTTKSKTPTPDVEVLEPESPDHAVVSVAAQQLGTFIGNLTTFFRGAMDLEAQAKRQLEHSKRLTLPTTAEEDAVVQVCIRQAKVTRKSVDDWWGITTVVHGLHRKLTAGRERAGAMLDAAASNAQTLHNRYVEAEQRRAREETDRLRREAEAREQAERDEEQARLEAAAMRAEEASPLLSAREEQFVEFYVLDIYAGSSKGNVQEAARRAGYKNALVAAARLATSPKVKAAIEMREQAELIRRQAQSLKNRPSTAQVEEVKPNILRSAGGFDRSSKSAEVYDPAAFLAAVLDPTTRMALGIPTETVAPVQTVLNELARRLGPQINRWPGVRLKTTTNTI